MKKVKRILSLITAIAVVLGTVALMPVSASAAAADSDYGLLWYSDFEAADLSSIDMVKTATTGSNSNRNVLAEADELRGKAFTFASTWGNNTATWTKNFASDVSGKKLNFSFQVKVRDTLATDSDVSSIRGFNVVQIRLFNDTTQIKGSNTSQNNRGNFMEIYYDYADGYTTSGAAHMLSGAWSGVKSAPQIGLNDLEWHQVDGVIDAVTKELKMYIDGTQVYPNTTDGFFDRASDIDPLLDAEGNFNFDQLDVFMPTISHDSTGADNGRWGLYDNFKITNTEGTSFGVIGTKKTDSALYLELSNTVLAGQTAPEIKLRKVGTNEVYAPGVEFAGSQAIKLDLSALTLSDNSEYAVEYPAGMNITDINGRSFDTAKEVTFYTDGVGNGATKARLVSANNSLLIPDGNAMRGIKGIELTFEEALTSPTATLTAEGEDVTVNMTNDGSKYTLSWNSLNADYYELLVKDGDTVVYEYSLDDVLTIDPIYPEKDGYGILWSNDFEVDTSGFEFKAGTGTTSVHDFGNGFMCTTTGSTDDRHRIIDMDDEYHKSGFGATSSSNNSWAQGTKTFDENIEGDLMVFSTQMKTSAYVPGYNAMEMYLYRDGTQLKGPNATNINHTKFLNLFMDNAETTMIGSASVFHSTYAGGYAAPKVNGIDDTDWHQIDIVVDSAEEDLILYIDGTHAYTNTSSYASICDAEGNFTFDQFVVKAGTNTTNQTYTYVDNVMITDAKASNVFGVSDVVVGTDAVYAQLSATVVSGQTAPAVTLRKVGTNSVINPTSVEFEGSQAIKISASGLEANTEYEIVYPESFTLTDITGRSIDKEQMVTFYTDGEGNGVTMARLVNLDNTLSIPTEAPSNAIKGMVIETEEAASSVTATLEGANDTVEVSVTGAETEWILAWGEFLVAEEYTLTVTADGNVVYTYVFTPEVSGTLSISEFAVYDAQGNEIRDWSDALRGQTLTATALIINPTGVDKFACVSYAAYANKWLKAVSYNDNDGEAIATTFNGTPIEISFEVPMDATLVKVMLWSGMDTMKPLAPAITID